MLNDARAAFATATLSLAYSLSTSALIFAGPLQAWLGLGTAAALVTATITAFVTALASGFRIAIASPTSTIAAALAVTIAMLEPVFARLPQDRVVPTVFAVLAITTLATGLALLVVGTLRMGKIVRFLPYPVVAGFMGISGWLLATGAFRMTTGVPLSPGFLQALPAPQRAVVAAMVAFALLLTAARRVAGNPAVVPGLLVLGVVATDLVVARIGPGAGLPADLMFRADAHLRIVRPFLSDMLLHVDWPSIATLVPSILAVILVTVLTALLTCSGLEADLDVDTDLDRELRVQGVANLVAGLAGGYVGLISVGTTMAARASGARTRAVGFANAFVCLAALVGGIALVAHVPRFVVGGLQLQVGAGVLWTWCIASRDRMPLSEWLLVLGIVAVAVGFGFLPAVLCGIAGGCVLFALAMSRVDIVRRSYGLDERGSSVVRGEAEMALLAARGARARVFELEGYIFFGSARRLIEAVHAALAAEPGWIVLDMTKVSGGDSSATAILRRLATMLRRREVTLVLAGLSPRLEADLRKAAVIDDTIALSPGLEAALERAEIAILDRDAGPEVPHALGDWLARALGGADLADRLLPLLRRDDLPAGAYVCRQGEPSDSLLFIERGRIAVMVDADGAERRVRVFGAQTIAGEQGFVLRSPRSASLMVERDATVWSLSRHSFDELARGDAGVVMALLRDIVRIQSERLSFASRQTTALTR